MRRAVWEYVLYYLQLTVAGIFLLILCAYHIHVAQEDFLERGMYSENVRGIQLSSEYLVRVGGEKVQLQIPKLKQKGQFMLYKRLSEEYHEIIRGIYGTGDVFSYTDYLEQGRFFSTEDYENEMPVAVIGAEMLDRTYVEDGIRYFGYQNQLYEVIGIFEKTDSELDNTVYLNLTNLLNHMEHHGLYYLDGTDSKVIEQVWDTMKEYAEGKYTISEVAYEGETYGLNQMNDTLLFCAVMAILLNLIVTGIFFVTRKKYTVAIQKMCGMTIKEQLLEYGKRMCQVVLAAGVSVVIFHRVFAEGRGFLSGWKELHWQQYGLVLAGMCVIGILLVYNIVRQVQNVDMSEALKGR